VTHGPDPVVGRHEVTGGPVRPAVRVVLGGDRNRIQLPAGS
jgi:hypothetical protein